MEVYTKTVEVVVVEIEYNTAGKPVKSTTTTTTTVEATNVVKE